MDVHMAENGFLHEISELSSVTSTDMHNDCRLLPAAFIRYLAPSLEGIRGESPRLSMKTLVQEARNGCSSPPATYTGMT